MPNKFSTVIIGITGESGVGKSGAAKILESLLPNAYYIHCDDYFLDYCIRFPNKIEKIIGEPVNASNMFVSIEKMGQKLTAESFKEFYTAIFSYANLKIAEDVELAISKFNPRFVIVEHMALPALNIWNSLNYKLLLETNNQELRLELLRKRVFLPANKKIAETRSFAIREYIDGVSENVHHTVTHSYGEGFDDEIKNVAVQIMEIFDYQKKI